MHPVVKGSRTPHCFLLTLLIRVFLAVVLHLWTTQVHTLPARVDIVAVKCVSTAGPYLSVGAKCQLSPVASLGHPPGRFETWPEALWNSILEAHEDLW
jgi:hypothetical protein